MISDTLAIGIHHLIADAESPFSRAVVDELLRLYYAAGEMPPLALYRKDAAPDASEVEKKEAV